MKCESGSGSSHFQPGVGPSRGLLRDYEPLDGPSFQSLVYSSFQLEAYVVWVQVQYLALVLMDILSAIVSTDSI